jgi:hypothetical protein
MPGAGHVNQTMTPCLVAGFSENWSGQDAHCNQIGSLAKGPEDQDPAAPQVQPLREQKRKA